MTTHAREQATGAAELAAATHETSASDRRPGRIARSAPWLAGLWVGFYVPMATLHLVRDTAPPWTQSPASASWPRLTSGQTSALIVALGLDRGGGGVALVTTSRGVGRVPVAGWLLVAVGLVLTLAVSDTRALSFVGYGPMLLLGLVGIGPVADGAVEGLLILGSLLALGSTVGGIGMLITGARGLSRRAGGSAFGTPDRALRIGRWAVAAAVLIPLSYAVTRLAWAVGYRLGVRDEFLVELGSAKWAGFGLGAFAVVGCLLTLGLVQRWGEVFWSWVPVIGGQRPRGHGGGSGPVRRVHRGVSGHRILGLDVLRAHRRPAGRRRGLGRLGARTLLAGVGHRARGGSPRVPPPPPELLTFRLFCAGVVSGWERGRRRG